MSVPKPASFEPLASSDPVPGDSYEVAALGRRLTDTADEISTQAANLRRLASKSTEFWTGKAASKFHDSAGDLADRIEKAHQRYATAGSALSSWAPEIDLAQDDVYQAVHDVQDAQATASANRPAPTPSTPPTTPPTAEQQAETRRRAAAYGDAQQAVSRATQRFHDAVDRYNSKAKDAANAIHDASSHDGLKDSWWDRNFGWISTVMKIVAIVIIVLVVIAIVLACPAVLAGLVDLGLSAGFLAGATTAAEWGAFGLTVASGVFDTAAAETGKGSWTAVGLDAFALCTFGFGKLAEAGVKGLTEGGGDVAKAVAGGRAGRAAAQAQGVPGWIYSLGSRSETLRSLFSFSPKLTGALKSATEAASKASESVEEALKAVKGSNALGALTQSIDLSTDVAKLSKLATDFPTVLRIAGARGGALGLAAVDGAAQSTAFVTAATYNISNDIKDMLEQWRIDETANLWRQPLVHVR